MKQLIFNTVRNAFDSLGFIIRRKQGKDNNYKWLQEHNIKTIIDIGANTGQFATFISEHLPSSKIHSFEPIPDVFKTLNESVKNLNICTYNLGLGAKNEETTININQYSASSSLLELSSLHKDNYKFAKFDKKEIIQLRRLDDVEFEKPLEDNILIKIDVQGFEDQVIKGGVEIIKKAKVVVMETAYKPLYEKEKTFDYHYNTMKNLGFEYQGIFFIDIKSNINGKSLFADLVFVKEDKN